MRVSVIGLALGFYALERFARRAIGGFAAHRRDGVDPTPRPSLETKHDA
ncbi:MAG: hypothetical protein AAF493_16130 [Pseudomonadota bacterium]